MLINKKMLTIDQKKTIVKSVVSEFEKVEATNMSYLVQNLRQHKLIDKPIGDAVVRYIN